MNEEHRSTKKDSQLIPDLKNIEDKRGRGNIERTKRGIQIKYDATIDTNRFTVEVKKFKGFQEDKNKKLNGRREGKISFQKNKRIRKKFSVFS